MKSARLILSILFVIAICPAVFAEETVVLLEDRFNEVLRPAAQISGAMVVGTTGVGDSVDRRPVLRAYLPIDWSNHQFCVSALSSDGRYEARNTYRLTKSWQGGIADIPFNSAHETFLNELTDDRMAVRTFRGDCNARNTEHTVSYWNVAPSGEENRQVVVLINSFRADRVFLYVGNDPAAEPVPCERLEGQAQTAFDTKCIIHLAAGTEADDEPVMLEINRERNRRLDPPVFVSLRAGRMSR